MINNQFFKKVNISENNRLKYQTNAEFKKSSKC